MFTTRPGGLLQLHTLTSWLDRKDDTAKRPVATVAKGSIVDVRAGWAKRQMGQDSKLRSLPSELLIVGDHEVSPVVNDSVGNCTGNCSLAANQKPVRSTSWLHRSIPSRPTRLTDRGGGGREQTVPPRPGATRHVDRRSEQQQYDCQACHVGHSERAVHLF